MAKEPATHIITFGQRVANLQISIERGVVGSRRPSFASHLRAGARIFLHARSQLWATGTITGDYFYSDDSVWENSLYPHRFNFRVDFVAPEPVPLLDGTVNGLFRRLYGPGWQYRYILSPKALPDQISTLILARFEAQKGPSYAIASEDGANIRATRPSRECPVRST